MQKIRKMIVLRNKIFSNIFKTMLRGAVKELGKDFEEEEYGKEILGILVIDRFVDKSRFVGKNCLFKVEPDFSVSGIWNLRSHIYWDLDEKFEPLDCFPKGDFKEFTISGTPKDNGTLDANILMKSGKTVSGRVDVKIK